MPLLAGGCDRPGIAGIFALRDGAWQPAGPPLPAALAGRNVDVLGMATIGARTQALLQAGTGSAAAVLAAWSDDGGASLAALRAAADRDGHGAVGFLRARAAPSGWCSATAGARGQAWVTARRWPAGRVLAGAGRRCPGGRRRSRSGLAGRIDALTAHASSFADWLLAAGTGTGTGTAAGTGAGTGTWRQVQTLRVTIPYGSSG